MIGLTLGNRYLIEENIGIGGMAVVFRAKDTLLNRNVAVKVLKNEFMDDDEFVKKFAMEAQSAASLSHQNIVSVYDVGSSTIENKKYNFIVMEYIDGKTLKEVIDEEGPLEPEYISKIGSQIAAGLEAAHKNGVVHRDIKPHNILITSDGIAKVTDFGIARISSSATITYTSTVLGTVHYISPEQAKGKFIDEKSDIYSLGVVLYEMATAKTPFDAENAVGIALKHIQDPLVEAKSINKAIPDGLNDIIIKAMEKNPADRFKNATELKIALLNYRNFKLNDNGEGKTERLGVIKDEDIEERRNKAVYNMPTEEEEEEEEEKKGVFKTYVLPILLAVLVLGTALLIFNVFFKDDGNRVVPALKELTYADAEKALKKEDLLIGIIGEEPEDLENSIVDSQDPAESTKVKKGDTINVALKPKTEEVEIPDLKNHLVSDAIRELQKLGFKVAQKEEFSDEIEKGKVIGTNPEAGKKADTKDEITIFVSKGRKDEGKVTVPSVIGFSSSEAKRQLEAEGLSWTTTSSYSNEYAEGKVTSQNVSAGTKVAKGSTIEINISKGKEPEETKPETSTANVEIDANSISQGEYTLKIEVNSGGQISVPYNKKHNTSEGNKSISIKGNVGDTYTVYVNGDRHKTGTIN